MNIKMEEKKDSLARNGILIISVLFIFVGIYRNEVGVVLKKAINICLECIGIG